MRKMSMQRYAAICCVSLSKKLATKGDSLSLSPPLPLFLLSFLLSSLYSRLRLFRSSFVPLGSLSSSLLMIIILPSLRPPLLFFLFRSLPVYFPSEDAGALFSTLTCTRRSYARNVPAENSRLFSMFILFYFSSCHFRFFSRYENPKELYGRMLLTGCNVQS